MSLMSRDRGHSTVGLINTIDLYIVQLRPRGSFDRDDLRNKGNIFLFIVMVNVQKGWKA